MLKAAFIFLAPGSNPEQHRSIIQTPEVELTVVGVRDYQMAEEAAKELIVSGVSAIELCGGFGNAGVALVAKAVGKGIPVGVVRFDIHPGLGGKSGDELF